MTLRAHAPAPWPPLGHGLHLDQATERGRQIIRRAAHDAHLREEPLGSNRAPYLDALCTRFGIPLGSYWCALWAGAVLIDCGCLVPGAFADCDRWLPYLVPVTAVSPGDRTGAAILYGTRGTGPVDPDYQVMKATGWNAVHLGLVADGTTTPMITVEGNRGYAGSPTNNGVAVDFAPTYRPDVLGLVLPRPSETV